MPRQEPMSVKEIGGPVAAYEFTSPQESGA